MAMRRNIRIGTAGWSISSAYRDRFPSAGTHLQRYARVMNAVEINSSFYRPHKRETYEKWAAMTPERFRFSVKTPKQATHDQRLQAPEDTLDRFAHEVSGLGRKLGVVLVQLPPSLPFDAAIAGRFFAALQERIKAPVACEPRHRTWFTVEVEAWLSGRRIARVAADPAPAPTAGEPGGWRGLTYFRLHGSPHMYHSAYEEDELDEMARRLAERATESWCILDNTASGAALGDALSLMEFALLPH